MTVKLLDMGAEIDRLRFLSKLTGVSLSSEQQEIAASIMRTLPQDATIGDFIEVCKFPLPEALSKDVIYANTWLPAEKLNMLKPLLEVLEAFATCGQYGRFFQTEHRPESAATTIEDPNAVINALTAQIKQLERTNEFLSNEFSKYTGLPDSVAYMLRHMRMHGIIPLYVGDQDCETLKSSFAVDPASLEAFEQVWFLNNAPVSQEVKDSLRKAANHGMSRW